MNKLQIAHIEYSIATKSLDIFTIGCYGNCEGCCNPEIKDFSNTGMSVEDTIFKLRELTMKYGALVDRFIIVGGDPVDGELTTGGVSVILKDIKMFSDKPIFLFTRHTLEEIPDSLKDNVEYIKTGAYIPQLTVDNNIQYGIKLATSNQTIYKKENGEWVK